MIRRLFIFAGCAALSAMAADAKFDAAVATNQLGLDLYRQLAKEHPKGNLVISPYSIDSALALAYSGADGATRTEMANLLHFPEDDASLQTSFASLRASLDEIARVSAANLAQSRKYGGGGEAIEWHQANRLFGQQGYAFRPSFLALMKDGYNAPFEPLDFRSNAEVARGTVNSWVEEQTRQKIRSLIPPHGLNSYTRLVLVNALYLKAPWQKPFKKTDTQPFHFHVSGAEILEVPTMQRTAYLGYVKEPGFTVVALDYDGGGLQFLILLPDEGMDCDALSARLNEKYFQTWAALGKNPSPTRVELYLPKFRVQASSILLGAALRVLGVKRAFDEPLGSADFSRIAPRRPDDYLALSEVFHKTFIAVDESGTEAAAATGILMPTGMGLEVASLPVVVRVDRPFLFAIQDRTSGACLFLGRIADPR